MANGMEIEFNDGEKRVLSTANRFKVENGVLHVWCQRESFGFSSWEEELGFFPLASVKSYRWLDL